MQSKPIFDPRSWETEGTQKKFEAKLIDATGQSYCVLVHANHFPGAYAKAKRLGTQYGMSLGHIAQV